MSTLETIQAVSPIDGRYAERVVDLQPIASEYGLVSRRLQVMGAWFSHLQSGVLPDVEQVSDGALQYLESLTANFGPEDALKVKAIEAKTNHDVKAVEVYLRSSIESVPELQKNAELIHFGATSEDVNNVAYAMMYRDARQEVLSPSITAVIGGVTPRAYAWMDVPMLSLTHGQAATPTTVGKELAVFSSRLYDHRSNLNNLPIQAKWNGATGNYAAATVAYPEVDWQMVNKGFLEKLGFVQTDLTTQIEPHDWMVRFLNELSLGNSIKLDLSRDMWGYIQRSVFGQKVNNDETGSSTMPHKVNPIDFENAEGNLGLANAVAGHLAAKLPVSRFQRDLSDSSALRAAGEVFGHTLIADKSLVRGLGKITINRQVTEKELEGKWEVLTEAVQTVMRRYQIPDSYNVVKAASRGKAIDERAYLDLVDSIDIPDDARKRLRDLMPEKFIGKSVELVNEL